MTQPLESTLLQVVAGVLVRRERVLLARRPAHKAHGNHWEFPGGKVETGESLALAMQRELYEELALEGLEVGRVIDVQATEDVQIHFMRVQTESAPVALEHSALGWYRPQEALQLQLAPMDRAFLVSNINALIPDA